MIKSVTFCITKEEIEEIFNEMISDRVLEKNQKLSEDSIINILNYVECDEFLAKDIRIAIRAAIVEVL